MEIPYEVTARRDTGLWNAKIGIWLFLASEVMLFGGLFSGYVFLRVGVTEGLDNPWPIDVQTVYLGFINTLVLIASSVFVVMAWVSLKMRNWRRFQAWMASVIVCALVFLVIKGIEYNGKFHHYGLKFYDDSLVEGEILKNSDQITFKVSKVNVDLTNGSLMFLKSATGTVPRFRTEDGKEVDLESWVAQEKKRVDRELLKQRKARRKEIALAEKEGRGPNAKPVEVEGTAATLTAVEPFEIRFGTKKIVAYKDGEEKPDDKEPVDTVSFRDGSKVAGTLISDTVKIEVHEVDLQMVDYSEQDSALVWNYLDDEAKEEFMRERDERLQEYRDYYEKHGIPIPTSKIQSRAVMVQPIHHGHQKDASAEKHPAETGGAEGEEHDAAASSHAEGEGAGKGEGHGVVIDVDRDDVKFLHNHGPGYGTYYAIYFTMTGLHGLHVIGGAIVLAYFLFFGKKLYLKNPEHMANRVEVGGLFWHFVDLVWIFLFPIMYLL